MLRLRLPKFVSSLGVVLWLRSSQASIPDASPAVVGKKGELLCLPLFGLCAGCLVILTHTKATAIKQERNGSGNSDDPSVTSEAKPYLPRPLHLAGFSVSMCRRGGLIKRFVDRARKLLDGPFTTLIGESYKRAYDSMVMVQQLAELEEIVGVKR